MIAHLHDILDAIIDSILGKLNGMPFVLRYFLKVLYEHSLKKYQKEYGEQSILVILSDFLIKEWLSNVCFSDSGINGLSKDFYLESNCKDNLKLLGEVMVNVFRFEELKCNDEIFSRYFNLFKKRKGDVTKYLRDLVSFDYNPGNPIKDDEKQRYVFQSMLLNLEDIKTIYDFFKDF